MSPRAGVQDYASLSKGTPAHGPAWEKVGALPTSGSLGSTGKLVTQQTRCTPFATWLPESQENDSLRVDEIHVSQRTLLI